MELCLEHLFDDARLKSLFHEKAKSAVQLWLCQYRDQSCRLVYGWVVPYHYSNNSWSVSNDDNFRAFVGCEMQVICLSAYLEASNLKELLVSLLDGKSLREASDCASITIAAGADSRFGHFALDESRVLKPVTYLDSGVQSDGFRPSSPVPGFSANSAAIASLEKESFIYNDTQSLSDIYEFIASELKKETGFDLLANDAARIGELELFSFPCLNEYGQSKVYVSGERPRTKLTIKPSDYDDYEAYVLKVSLLNDNQILRSLMYFENYDGSSDVYFDFTISEYEDSIVDGRIFEVYGRCSGCDELSLLYKNTDHFVREISLASSLSRLSGTFESKWIRNYTQLSPDDARMKKVESISKFSKRDVSLIGGRDSDSWVGARREMKKQVAQSFPSKSEGRFFPRHTEGEGRLEFVEWWKALFDKYAGKEFVIFDPYFEDVGLELIARHANGGSSVTVFTCGANNQSDRVENIKLAFEHLSEVFSGVHLRVYTIPNIHDRYLMILDENKQLYKGFSLSNSVQAANADNPLLLTPIPADVLLTVNRYIDSVLSDEHVSSLEFCSKAYFERKAQDYRKSLHSEVDKSREPVSTGEVIRFLEMQDACEVATGWMDIAARIANSDKGSFFSNDDILSEQSLDSLLAYLNVRFKVADTHAASATLPELCSYLNAPLESLQNELFDVDRHGFVAMTKYSTCCWGDYYAIKLLYKFHTAKFISVLDGWLEDYQVVGASREKSELLLQCISEISTCCIFRDPQFSVDMLLASRSNILQWIAFSHIEAGLNESGDTDALSAALNLYTDRQKVQWLGWCLNRAMLLGDEPGWSGYAISRLLLALPNELSKADIVHLVDSIRGRMQHLGYASHWFPKKIIEPLIKRCPKGADEFLSIWVQEIFNQFDKFSSSGDLSNRDLMMTDIAVQLFLMGSDEAQSMTLKKFDKRMARMERSIRRPLAFGIHWSKWYTSLKVVAWIYGFINWQRYYTDGEKRCSVPEDLDRVSKRVDRLLVYRPKSVWISEDDGNYKWHRFFKDPA